MKTLRQTSRSATEMQLADPDARYNTVTIRNTVSPKKAGSATVYNAKSNVVHQKTATLPVDPACTDKCAPKNQEKLSISVSLSGSTESKEEISQMWLDVKAIIDQNISSLALGFLPDADTVITIENSAG